MPRPPRLDPPGITRHVVQRGNDRQPCFFAPDDCARYLQDLREPTLRKRCQVHAYVLMTNHVHLLAAPAESAASGCCRPWAGATSATSTTATTAPARSGRGATRPAWSAATATCCIATFTWISTPSVPAWSPTRPSTPGPATATTPWGRSTPSSRPTPRYCAWQMSRGSADSTTAAWSGRRSTPGKPGHPAAAAAPAALRSRPIPPRHRDAARPHDRSSQDRTPPA